MIPVVFSDSALTARTVANRVREDLRKPLEVLVSAGGDGYDNHRLELLDLAERAANPTAAWVADGGLARAAVWGARLLGAGLLAAGSQAAGAPLLVTIGTAVLGGYLGDKIVDLGAKPHYEGVLETELLWWGYSPLGQGAGRDATARLVTTTET